MKKIILSTLCLCMVIFGQTQNLSQSINIDSSFQTIEKMREKFQTRTKGQRGIDIYKVPASTNIISKTITIAAGGLYAGLSSTERASITNLTIKGNMDARDFRTLRDHITYLSVLDLSEASIKAYTGNGGTDTTGFVKTYDANTIPQCAFWDPITNIIKARLTSITMPSTTTAIGKNAFEWCKSITNLILPPNLTRIDQYAFQYCLSLNSIEIPSTLSEIEECTFSGTGLTNITIPSTINSIGFAAFWDCQQLKSADISAANIGTYAFDSCTVLNSVKINPTVKSIGNEAFYKCISLTSIDIPSSVDFMDSYSFYKCTGLKIATVASKNIGKAAFHGCTNLDSVKIQPTVITIDEAAFANCNNLSSIIIPSTIDSIGVLAFWNCTGLKTTTVASNSIGKAAFYGCTSLNSVTINPTVKSIKEYAFTNCNNLNSIIIPSTVDSIGGFAFWNCTGLETATVASNRIGKASFYVCTALNSVTLASTVNNIDISVFNGCINLTSIYALRSTPVVLSTTYLVFYNVNKTTCTLYVPNGSKSLYQNSFQWKDFTNIVEVNTSVPQINKLNLIVYPNPIKDFVKIENLESFANLSVNNLQGKELINRSILPNEIIPVSSLPKGLYVIRVKSSDGEFSTKLLKE